MNLEKVSSFEVNDINIDLDGIEFAYADIPVYIAEPLYMPPISIVVLSAMEMILYTSAFFTFIYSIVAFVDNSISKKEDENDRKITKSRLIWSLIFSIGFFCLIIFYRLIMRQFLDYESVSDNSFLVNLGIFLAFLVLLVVGCVLRSKNKKNMKETEETTKKTLLVCKNHRINCLIAISIIMILITLSMAYFITIDLRRF